MGKRIKETYTQCVCVEYNRNRKETLFCVHYSTKLYFHIESLFANIINKIYN